MGFWDKVKDGIKADLEKAKSAAYMIKMELDYIGGCPGVTGKKLEITKNKQTGEVKLGGRTFQLRNIQWQESATRSAGKAAAGAIIGGVLTGGIGAVAGAAIGGRKKDRSQAIITVEDNGQEYMVYVRCSEEEFAELTAFLN